MPPSRTELLTSKPETGVTAPIALSSLVAQVGSEVASALSTALERVNAIATTGRLDRGDLRALREEIELARLTGIMAQQISRLAERHVPLTPEPLDLTTMVREALQQRGREIEARGLRLRQRLEPAIVVGDTTLTWSLLQSLMDWSVQHARSDIGFEIDHRTWPERAMLVCRFTHRAPDEAGEAPPPPSALETMSWRLLQQTAATLRLPLSRVDDDGVAGRTRLTVEFPHTVARAPRLAGSFLLDPGFDAAAHPRPLAGSHVLVIAARREVRNLVREALRPFGLTIDFVTSVAEAREFCRGGMPHAIVHEAALGGEPFDRLRSELRAEMPRLAFIQITEDGAGFEVRSRGAQAVTTVARASIVDSLPAALVFELG